jgi:hypothetical protein
MQEERPRWHGRHLKPKQISQTIDEQKHIYENASVIASGRTNDFARRLTNLEFAEARHRHRRGGR